MFRKRLAVCILATLAVPGMTTWAHVAHAQDVIDLDEEPTPKKGGKAKKANGEGDTGAKPNGHKPSGKKGVDIDLDEADVRIAEVLLGPVGLDQGTRVRVIVMTHGWSSFRIG